MAVYANLTVDQGTDFSSAIDVTDSDGDPVSLVGYTVAGQIRKHYNSSTKVDFVATVSNATAGIVSLSLSAATTNAMKAGRYVYDVEIDLNGTKTRVLEGQLEVTPGVTR
tara:strand:+ start:525 stop:854 length:330 start_codon:yes stop_codon:yes gene_type:complete